MHIRSEEPNDLKAISALTTTAFAPMAFSDGTEAEAIDILRADGNLVLSLVAIQDGTIAGHIAFSPATIGITKNAFAALGPISVYPERQKKGIGSALINTGLTQIKDAGFCGCVLTGNPNYYHRFGFQSSESLTYRDTPTKNVMWLSFDQHAPVGELVFSRGLE